MSGSACSANDMMIIDGYSRVKDYVKVIEDEVMGIGGPFALLE